MTFAKLDAHHYYLRVDYEKMRLYNYKGGWQDIDENSEDWMFATLVEADSWRDLYLKTGYCPVACFYAERDIWMDPDGATYEGDGHELYAEKIGEILFGVEECCGDDLIRYGWIKLTTGPMLPIYLERGFYDNITYEQERTIRKWADANKILLFNDIGWA